MLLFSPLAVLIALSLWLNFDSWRNQDTWVLVVFGGSLVFILVSPVVMPRRYYLRLTPKALTVSHLIGSRTYQWPEVSNFRVVSKTLNWTPAGNLIVFDLAEGSPHQTAARRLARAINGYDVSVMALFSLDAEDVAELLNEWQQRYAVDCG